MNSRANGSRSERVQTISQRIRRRAPNFVSHQKIPIIHPSTSISDTLNLMREQGTQGVLIREKDRQYRFFWADHISGAELSQRGIDPSKTSISQFLDDFPRLDNIDAVWMVKRRASFSSNNPRRVLAVVAGNQILGLLTTGLEFLEELYTSAVICTCTQNPNHRYPPPPPKDGRCWIDGAKVDC